jgi:hypothetical protein
MTDQIIPITKPSSLAAPTRTEQPKYPTEVVDLVTKGWFYPPGSPLSSGTIELKMMTAREEDILTSQNLIKKGIVLDKLLESLLVDKSIKIDELLLADKDGLFVAIRRLAYGDKYGPLTITCPKCGKETKGININLGEIKTKEFNFDAYPRGVNEFKYELPYSKKVITYKLLSHKDEKDIETELEGLSKINKQVSNDITTRLKKIIVAIDDNRDPIAIRKFVDEELPSRDSLSLRTHIRENSPEVDLNFNFVCGKNDCEHEERTVVPLTIQFFWPKS